MTTLHTAIATDLEEVLPLLAAAGFVVQSSDYDADAFGNYVAEFVAPHGHSSRTRGLTYELRGVGLR